MDRTEVHAEALALVAEAELALDAAICPRALALLEVMRARRLAPGFSSRSLSLGQLSRLLWAAAGLRESNGALCAAPPARPVALVQVFACVEGVLWRFEPQGMRLLPAAAPPGALLQLPAGAPLTLLYISHPAGLAAANPAQADLGAALEAGRMAQNVSLFCAAECLNCLALASANVSSLGLALALRPAQQLLLVQSIGFPVGGAVECGRESWS